MKLYNILLGFLVFLMMCEIASAINISEPQSYLNWNDTAWIKDKDLVQGTDNYPYRIAENSLGWRFTRGTDILNIPKSIVDVVHLSPSKISFEIHTTKEQVALKSVPNGTGMRYIVIPQSLLKARFLFDDALPDVCIAAWGNCSKENIYYSKVSGETRLNIFTNDYLSLNSTDSVIFKFNSYDVNASSTLDVDYGVYNVSTNFTCTSTCLTIGANNLTLDLMGYTLTFANTSTGYGIANSGYDNVTIKNGSLIQGNLSTITNRGVLWQLGSNYGTIQNITTITNNTNSYGIYLLTSSNNNTLTSNTGTSNTSYGIFLSTSSNNTLTSNTGTSNTSIGIHLYSSSNNNTLTSNTGTSNASVGIYLLTSSNNTLTSNTGTSNTSIGIYLFTSSNNILTSNTFNTDSTTSTIGAILVRDSYKNNTFVNTNFTIPRKITFYDTTSEFNQSQDSVSFVSTNSSVARTVNRSILNWNTSNITFTATWSGATTAYYNVTGLLPNTVYNIYNDSVINYTYTSDSAGQLTNFTIDYTTSAKTITILEYTFTSSNNTISCPVGWCYLAMNYTNKTLLQLDPLFTTDVVQGWFNASTQRFESHSTYSSNQNVNVTQKSGYYYYFKTATNVNINMTENPLITLKSGWNLVGNMDTNRTISELETSIGGTVVSSSHWNNTHQHYINDPGEIVPVGEPLMVNVSADTVWGG